MNRLLFLLLFSVQTTHTAYNCIYTPLSSLSPSDIPLVIHPGGVFDLPSPPYDAIPMPNGFHLQGHHHHAPLPPPPLEKVYYTQPLRRSVATPPGMMSPVPMTPHPPNKAVMTHHSPQGKLEEGKEGGKGGGGRGEGQINIVHCPSDWYIIVSLEYVAMYLVGVWMKCVLFLCASLSHCMLIAPPGLLHYLITLSGCLKPLVVIVFHYVWPFTMAGQSIHCGRPVHSPQLCTDSKESLFVEQESRCIHAVLLLQPKAILPIKACLADHVYRVCGWCVCSTPSCIAISVCSFHVTFDLP